MTSRKCIRGLKVTERCFYLPCCWRSYFWRCLGGASASTVHHLRAGARRIDLGLAGVTLFIEGDTEAVVTMTKMVCGQLKSRHSYGHSESEFRFLPRRTFTPEPAWRTHAAITGKSSADCDSGRGESTITVWVLRS